MKVTLTALAFAAVSTVPAFAAGNAEAGKKVFNQCQACHSVVDPNGKVLAGKNAKTGPNLYAVIGRPAASYPEFKYGEGILELSATGYIWTEENLATYVQDPAKFLSEKTGNKNAKSKMMFKIKKEEYAANVAAFLASLAQAPAAN